MNSEDADIWSTSDDVTGDDQQPPPPAVSRRNGLIGYRSSHNMNGNPETQSIRSNESHLSQQEIMPSEIRKRLTEVQTSGPILFEVSAPSTRLRSTAVLHSAIPKIRRPRP